MRKNHRIAAAIALIAGVAGCSDQELSRQAVATFGPMPITEYKPYSKGLFEIPAGYSDERLDDKRWRVSYAVSPSSSLARGQALALKRALEIGDAHGATRYHFGLDDVSLECVHQGAGVSGGPPKQSKVVIIAHMARDPNASGLTREEVSDYIRRYENHASDREGRSRTQLIVLEACRRRSLRGIERPPPLPGVTPGRKGEPAELRT